MITVFLLLSIGCIILADVLDNSNCKLSTIVAIPYIIGVAGCVIFGIWTTWNVICVASGFGIEEKIQIYEDQNTQIEQSIDAAVKAYCEHEQITYVQMSDGAVALVAAAYPELVDFHRAQYFLYFGGELS